MPRVKKPAKVKDLYGVTGNSPDGIAGKTRYEYVMYDILQNLPTTPNNRLNLPTDEYYYNKSNRPDHRSKSRLIVPI